MARLSSIPHPLRRFVQVDGRRRLLVVEAATCLLAARLALVFVPFPRLARRLGTFVSPTDPRASHGAAQALPRDALIARETGWAVTRAARHVPFRAVCLPQAMAAQFMLRRRGVTSVMRFGAGKKVDSPLEAHAWLDAANVEVTGYPVAPNIVEIACFV
ncbi:MAG: lasso peptide biosynthesis B2 protein [Rhizomicrobium sp.]